MTTVAQVQEAKVAPFKTQLLKWVGNKQRFAHEIASTFPISDDTTYFEPFLGSAAVLGTLAPKRGVASDCFQPLIDIWKTLASNPEILSSWYEDNWVYFNSHKDRVSAYNEIRERFNEDPNGKDLLFLSRSSYGGVIRFRQKDGYMSTPCGAHNPINPDSFRERAYLWSKRIEGTSFYCSDYRNTIRMAGPGDVVYCDPPYSHSQAILYGAQSFQLESLYQEISEAKSRGAFVALSIDGTKKSGQVDCEVAIPDGLFERQLMVNVGRSMLKRFQMGGKTLEGEGVFDRLLLTQ